MRLTRLLPAGLLCLLALAPSALAADRYSLANHCWTATDAASGSPVAEQVFLKPTALGSYLLYTKDGKYLAAGEGGLAPADAPSSAADFVVTQRSDGAFALAPKSTKATVATVTFAAAQGCADFPEAPLNATGKPFKGATSYGAVRGIVEGHNHWMAFGSFGARFRCGKPWDAYGITVAMPDCADRYGPEGSAAPLQNALGYGNPVHPHDTSNWPKFPNQSKDDLLYEGEYYRWVQRVYMAGMRLMVMSINENRVLCEALPDHAVDCNEMNGIRRGFEHIKALQDYVDAQAGGPGKGFLQIVTTPFEAREVINRGQMAVVLEIETSEPFDCKGWEQVSCDKAQIAKQIDEMNAVGVRSSLLLNKYDNPLTGVRFDSGIASYVINAGNKQSAGSFWDARTCAGKLHDNEITSGDPTVGAAVNSILAPLGFPTSTIPQYPPAPHCNTRGLTELGRFAVERMIKLGWVVNPDHMSQAAVDDTLTLLEAHHYSGVISPHGWMDPGNWPRLWKLGGMVFPGHSGTDSYVKDWRDYRPRETPYAFGWGFGADLGGLSHQPDKAKKGAITYPFKSFDGKVTFTRQKTGERTFDFAKEGVAHFGLYADWLADLRRVGGRRIADDMMAGAEAYLEMWERANGVPVRRCPAATGLVDGGGLGPIRLGATWQKLLRRAGQPQQRTRAWSWCVDGRHNRHAADVAVLSPAGTVQLVGSTARGRVAHGIGVSDAAGALGSAPIAVRRSGSRTFVYALRDGRVRAVATASSTLAAQPAELRSAMRLLLAAKATSIPRRFIPAKAQAKGRMLGRVLAGGQDARATAQLALLCNLAL